jgi:hypothetical protein
MVKCFKLPEIQVCIAFEGFLPGDLRGKNRVVSRYKISIFTIDKIVKLPGGNTRIKKFTAGREDVDNWWNSKMGPKKQRGQAFSGGIGA